MRNTDLIAACAAQPDFLRRIVELFPRYATLPAIGSAGDREAGALVRREHRVGSYGAGEEQEFCFMGALGTYGSAVGSVTFQ